MESGHGFPPPSGEPIDRPGLFGLARIKPLRFFTQFACFSMSHGGKLTHSDVCDGQHLPLKTVFSGASRRRQLARAALFRRLPTSLLRQGLDMRPQPLDYRLELEGWDAEELPGVDVLDRDKLDIVGRS